MPSIARVLKSKTVYQGKVIAVKIDRVAEPGGVTATREVVCHGGSVVVLPRLEDSRVLLVRQFRYPARRFLWELVAGSIEPGETPGAAARRELIEEAGYRPRAVKPLLDFFSSPGFLTERMFLVEASRLEKSVAQPEADERIEVGLFTHDELRRMIRRKTIRDGKTLVGLLWLLGANGLRVSQEQSPM